MRLAGRMGLTIVALLLATSQSYSADPWGLKKGAVELKSAGPLAFGPEGILFVGDPTSATLWAIATEDTSGELPSAGVTLAGVEAKLGEALAADQVKVNDLAVNPVNGNVYLSVSVGQAGKGGLARVTPDGKVSKVDLGNVRFSQAVLADAPLSQPPQGRRRNPRDESITDLTYIEGKVYVSGLADPDSPSSSVREIPFPFAENVTRTNIEIYHAAHGKYETNAPVRTLTPLVIDGEPALLAGFTCTPLVKLPLNSLTPNAKVRGTTVAELGNRNQPLDMIVYKKDGKEFVLVSNTARGVMKVSTEKIAENAGLTEAVRGGGTAGQPYETIKELTGVEQLDRLDDKRAVILAKADGALALRTIELP